MTVGTSVAEGLPALLQRLRAVAPVLLDDETSLPDDAGQEAGERQDEDVGKGHGGSMRRTCS